MEILVREGETVEVGTTVAFIDPDAVAGAGPVPAEPEAADPPPESAEFLSPRGAFGRRSCPAPAREEEALGNAEAETAEDRLRTRSTPVVRKIAEEHGVDLAQVPGTGHAGRVTKDDILAFIEGRG